MKLVWKKRIFNPYTLCVLIALPVVTVLFQGFDTGLLPKFWQQLSPGESAAGDDLSIFSHVRHMEAFVDVMEWYVSYSKNLIPLLAAFSVIPFIQLRDRFLPFACVRIQHPRRTERKWIVQSVVLSGCTVYGAYLLTMLWARWMCTDTYHDYNCFEVFFNQWGWQLTGQEHPYLYILALGALRCLILPMLMAMLTIAVSYLTKKIYIYLLIPTIYYLVMCSICSQSGRQDRWPLPLFSPENMVWPSSPSYWQFGHNVHGIWGVVCASLIIIVPSLVIIWWGMRKRRA